MAPSWGSGCFSPPWRGTGNWSLPVQVCLLCSSHLHTTAPGTNLSPPDQLIALVPIGLIDLHERVRFAEQILEIQEKGPISLERSAKRAGEEANTEKGAGLGPWDLFPMGGL
jgi:hypothetical protein